MPNRKAASKKLTLKSLTALLSLSVLASPAMAQQPGSLSGLNDKMAIADKVWALRSGLNVAALQCQFSPFLATVPTYNAFLRQHSDELTNSFKSLTSHFVRTHGQRAGQRAFDTYATRANQGWATFDAQYSFCEKAAIIGRKALGVPKGQFGEFARLELDNLRSSLVVSRSTPNALQPKLEWASVPQIGECKKGKCKPTRTS